MIGIPPALLESRRRWLGLVLGAAVLAAQNLLFFSHHYFLGWAVPWDFGATYHAVPHYWIEAARHGVSMAWVPFQGMGYPLYINLQSGLYYPPFWVFVLADRPYTLEAAVVMQGLHVLFGGVGAAVCARLLGVRWQFALLAAVFYQGFGGFYSNASHPDIVRSYALAPWLCGPFLAQWRGSRLWKISTASLPLWVYALWTGGYAGSFVAQLFVLAVLLMARLSTERTRGALRHALLLAGAVLAGLLLAGISLVPALLDRMEIQRLTDTSALHYDLLVWRDVFAPLLRVDQPYFGHDITMRSWSIGLPALALLLMRPFLGHARWASGCLLIGVLAVAMASEFLHAPVTWLLPPLGYSRFPVADYRALAVLAAILLAVQSMQLVAQRLQPDSRWRHAGLALLAIYVGAALWAVYPARWNEQDPAALLLGLALVVGAFSVARRQAGAPKWLVPALILLTAADWMRLHWGAEYFQNPAGASWLEARLGSSLKDARKSLTARLATPPACRPARTHIAMVDYVDIPWRGYYNGQYMSQDYAAAANLRRLRAIAQTPPLYEFALRPWTAVLLPSKMASPQEMVDASRAPVQCVHYGPVEQEYRVNLQEAATVVENEVYWRGWTANIAGRPIEAIDANGFRAWSLPAGQYRMVTRFRAPWLAHGVAVSVLGALSWGVLLLALSARGRP